MRILITGCAGMLGRAVVAEAASRHDVAGVDLPDGDLTDADAVSAIFAAHAPECVIHCAAWTDVDGAEAAEDAARAGNALATANLAKACDASGAALITVSTDYVFAGDAVEGYREDDPRDPINAYGRTKAEAEEAVEAMTGRGCVVRTSWLFGPGPKNFVITIRRLLGERDRLRVVDDQRGSPTYAPDLAGVLVFLAASDAAGIFHATNAGVCTWYEFACAVAEGVGADPERIEPCGGDDYPTPARRPACSVLLSRRLEESGCPPRRGWREALAAYLDLSTAAPDRGEAS